MTRLRNDYAAALTEKRILYVPSCLIVEMLATLSGQVAGINLGGSLHNVTPDLLILLRRMRHNLRVTSEAYEASRIRYFIGDWHDDKRRARKLFFNILSSLGYISELLEKVERTMLFTAIEAVTAEWTALDKLVDAKSEERKCQAGGVCGAYCNCNAEVWRAAMAASLVPIHDTTDYGEVDCLLLLCHDHARRQIADAVETAVRETDETEHFSPERILALSKEKGAVVCKKCSEPDYGDGGTIPFSLRAQRRRGGTGTTVL